MSSSHDTSHVNTLRAKKAGNHPQQQQQQQQASPATPGPTTFFLRSEKDIENTPTRGRRASWESEDNEMEKKEVGSVMSEGTSFGVQSLEDTMSTSLYTDDGLSRTESNPSDAGEEARGLAGRKRKANPVHPKIAATGQRIISSEYVPRNASPMSLRSTGPHQRRGSAASSINMSQPLTPLKMSPRPQSAMPSTPRSGSPKSFRLSDEEASVASDSNSQVIQSSSEEDDEPLAGPKAPAMPQLVMPSLAMPARRPFTERGRHMGRLKVMVVGAKGVGKTSLIQSICRACEDIVHVDSLAGSTPGQSILSENHTGDSTNAIVEIGASTRSYPTWWTDFETRRTLLRRKSLGDGVLERNLTFIDTPGFHSDSHVDQVSQYFKTSLSRTATMEKMKDSELVSMLSGEGGVQIDAVIYVFDSTVTSTESPVQSQMDSKQAELLQYLCKWTNVIPVVGRADGVEETQLLARKRQLMEMFNGLSVQPHICRSIDELEKEDSSSGEAEAVEPFAVSSALSDDADTIDASILMSSAYLQPFIPSELETFINQLFEPEHTAHLRHLSATKFLLWRQQNMGTHLDLQKQLLLSPQCTSPGSIPDDPSKVLVPHGTSSYFRSTSPSEASASASASVSPYTLALNSPSEPFRQVRLAKWAQDLQRSLDNDRRRRYHHLYPSSDWGPEKDHPNNLSLIRPAKGRLGGDLAIIDPRDPLGLLAFTQSLRRRGWLLGTCGILGAVAWWVTRNWADDLLDLLGWGQDGGRLVSVAAVPAPEIQGGLPWER